MKEKLQEESRTKYGLTSEQISAAVTELEELATKLKRTASDSVDATNPSHAAADNSKLPSLLESDPSNLTKEDKLALLNALHQHMQSLNTLLEKSVNRRANGDDEDSAPSPDSDQENKASNSGGHDDGIGGTRTITASTLAKAHRRRPATTTSTAAGGAIKTKRTKSSSLAQKTLHNNKRDVSVLYDSDDDNDGGDDGFQNVEQIAACADVETLVAMGFSKRQAEEALDEADGSVEGAAEWLMVHCI